MMAAKLFCLFLSMCSLGRGCERASCALDNFHADGEEATFLQVSQGEQLKTEGASSIAPWCFKLPCETAKVICKHHHECCNLANFCRPTPFVPAATSCYAISCKTAKQYCQQGKPHGRCCDHAHKCRSEAPTKPPASLTSSVSTAQTPTAWTKTELAGSLLSRSESLPLVAGFAAAIVALMDYYYYLQIKDYSILTNVGNSFSHSFPGFIQNWDAVVSDNGKYGMLINDCDIYGVIFGDNGFGNNYGKMDVAFKSTACYFEAKYSGEICAYNSSVHFDSGTCDTVWLEAGVNSPVLKMEDSGTLCYYDMYNNEVGCSETFEELREIQNEERKQFMTSVVIDTAEVA